MQKINSITAYKITDLDGMTLADIRTDGKKAVVLDDKSNGIIKNIMEAGWVRGREIIEQSAQYKVEANIGIGIYYFNLSTGDSLAVTTDDRCAAINGEMCDDIEFAQLLHMLNTQQITASSAGHGSPVSMLYNLALHSDEKKHKFDHRQAEAYGDHTKEDLDKKDAYRHKVDLAGLSPEHDYVAIQILKSHKAGE